MYAVVGVLGVTPYYAVHPYCRCDGLLCVLCVLCVCFVCFVGTNHHTSPADTFLKKNWIFVIFSKMDKKPQSKAKLLAIFKKNT